MILALLLLLFVLLLVGGGVGYPLLWLFALFALALIAVEIGRH